MLLLLHRTDNSIIWSWFLFIIICFRKEKHMPTEQAHMYALGTCSSLRNRSFRLLTNKNTTHVHNQGNASMSLSDDDEIGPPKYFGVYGFSCFLRSER